MKFEPPVVSVLVMGTLAVFVLAACVVDASSLFWLLLMTHPLHVPGANSLRFCT